jgi:hypothetical protein
VIYLTGVDRNNNDLLAVVSSGQRCTEKNMSAGGAILSSGKRLSKAEQNRKIEYNVCYSLLAVPLPIYELKMLFFVS